jgi:PAS domain S-box-containing protein
MPPTYRKQRPWHDGVIVAAMILGALLISRRLNLFPAIAQAYGIETVMALDDLMLVAMVLALALAVFAVRRWREAAAESVERRRTEFDLNERVKELTCLHAVTQVTDRHDLSLAEILGECVSLLPPAWLNPGIAEAHITFQGQSYATAGYVETPWMQSAEIAYFGQPAGRVAVCYRQAQPQADEGPFLREERALLDTVAERLGQVAERIHDAQELRSSESRYRTLFDSIGDAIFIHDQQGHILEVNSAACSRLGYTHDELVSLMLQDIDPDFGRLVPGLRASGATRDMLIFETTHLCRDGRAIPSEMSSRLTEYEGRPAVLTVARDISERKEGERAARELTRQLAIRNRIANVFLAAEDADLYNDVLQQVLEVMESPFGIFGYIDADHNLVCPSLTGAVWTKCQVEARTTVFPHKSWTGVWGQALAENRAIYRNKGFTVPAGHIPIERALAVPIRYQNEPIGLLLVANKGATMTMPAVIRWKPSPPTSRRSCMPGCAARRPNTNDRPRWKIWRIARRNTACSSMPPVTASWSSTGPAPCCWPTNASLRSSAAPSMNCPAALCANCFPIRPSHCWPCWARYSKAVTVACSNTNWPSRAACIGMGSTHNFYPMRMDGSPPSRSSPATSPTKSAVSGNSSAMPVSWKSETTIFAISPTSSRMICAPRWST